MLPFQPRSIAEMIGVAASFWLLLAAMALPAAAAIDHDSLLRDRLTEVRELLKRRQAHRQMLDAQIEEWSSTLDQLQWEREEALLALAEQIDRTRGDERELDRLIPKILPRLKTLESLRREGARAIADLAKIGRDPNVKASAKARFSATRTVSIDQMRRASTSLRLLRRFPNDRINAYRDLDFQLPLLETAVERVSNQQDRLQRRRDRAIRKIADLSVDIERLTAEEHRLARNMLARSLTAASRSTTAATVSRKPVVDRRNRGKADIARAEIKGTASGSTQSRGTTPPAGEAASVPTRPSKSMVAVMPGRAITGKASALVAGWTDRNDAGRLSGGPLFEEDQDVAGLQAEPLSSLSSRVARGRIEEGRTLVPTGDMLSYTLADIVQQGDQPAIEIAAMPRQRVAAPDDGVVVFANDFRSYGLLLIIEHDSEYHTLLWGFSSLDIELGDQVRAGQIVGTAGAGVSPKLHVELRRNGQPVSPEVWLAASNSGVEG